jgi:hypothetical protein
MNPTLRVNLKILETRFVQTTCVNYCCNILAVNLFVATVLLVMILVQC